MNLSLFGNKIDLFFLSLIVLLLGWLFLKDHQIDEFYVKNQDTLLAELLNFWLYEIDANKTSMIIFVKEAKKYKDKEEIKNLEAKKILNSELFELKAEHVKKEGDKLEFENGVYLNKFGFFEINASKAIFDIQKKELFVPSSFEIKSKEHKATGRELSYLLENKILHSKDVKMVLKEAKK